MAELLFGEIFDGGKIRAAVECARSTPIRSASIRFAPGWPAWRRFRPAS
jgi:hypothetical protein